jgi:hypothetical protein
MMHDIVLPGEKPREARVCLGSKCVAELPRGPEGPEFHTYGRKVMAEWRMALAGESEDVKAFKARYRKAEPEGGHDKGCPFENLPAAILVQAADGAEAARWLQEMHAAPSYQPRATG